MDSLAQSIEDSDAELESVSDTDPMIEDKKTVSNSSSIPLNAS